jgi:hypothetical protein
MDAWVRYSVAIVVFAHGLIYLVTPLSSSSKTVFGSWKGTSWLLGSAISTGALKTSCSVLWMVAGLGLVGASFAIVLAPWIPGIWRPLAMGGSAVGIVSFLIFWDGVPGELVNEGVIGLAVSAVILLGSTGLANAFG